MSEGNKATIQELEIKFTASTEQIKAALVGVVSEIDEMKKVATSAGASMKTFKDDIGHINTSNSEKEIAELRKEVEELSKRLDEMKSKGQQSTDMFESLKKQLAGVSLAYIGKQMIGVGKNAVEMAMDVVESESLFETSMGNMAQKAYDWSEEVSKALGLNAYSVRNNVGVLYNMTTAMGIADSTAYDLSTTMVGLSYDMASFYNLDPEEAFSKLQSGLVGTTQPLRQLGILVDETTVKNAAYKHGLVEQGEELTQQQKVIARYLAILDQTSNAQGDMARTLDSPANQMRRMKEEWTQASIALGQALLPVVKEVIPYVSALAQIAKEAISGVAGLAGTTVSLASASGNLDTSNITSSLSDITEEAENAESALKGATLGIDELNILSSSTDADDVELSGSYSYDLSTSGYDLIGDLTAQTSEAYETMKGWLAEIKPIAEAIGSALVLYGSYKILSGIKNLGTGLKGLKDYFGKAAGDGGANGLVRALVGVGGIVWATSSAKDMVYELTMGTANLGDVIGGIVGTGGGIALAAMALGSTGGIIAGVGALTGAIIGTTQANEDFKNKFVTEDFFSNKGRSIDDLTDSIKASWGEFDTYSKKQEGYQQEMDRTSIAIDGSKTSLETLVDQAHFAGSKEGVDAGLNNIEEEFNNLKTNVEANLVAENGSVVTMLGEVRRVADEDTAKAIQGLTEKFIYLQSLIGNEISSEEAKVYKILSEARENGSLTKSQSAELKKSIERIASFASSGQSATYYGAQTAIKEAQNIAFESPEQAKTKLNELLDQRNLMKKEIEDSYNTSMESISHYETIVNSDSKVREAFSAVYGNYESVFEEGRQAAELQRQNALADMQDLFSGAYRDLMSAYTTYIVKAGDNYASAKVKKITSAEAGANPLNWWEAAVATFDTENYMKVQAEEGVEAAKKQTQDIYRLIESIAGYATGGYPERAQLFYAREDGMPELVGRIGSDTAVANNYQIEQGISDAVYRAVVSAKSFGGGGNDQPLIIQIVDEAGTIRAEQFISAAERKNLRDGRVTIPLGV